ncbi:MAG: O-antigen ligase family protein, partial [Cyanobacteria bacterium P01_A01_bin.135]
WAFGAIVVLSLIYGIALPKYGIMGGVHAGTWRGIYTHKNTLGKMMALSSAVFTLLVLDNSKNRLVPAIFLGFSLVLILLTTSKGALVIFGMMLAIIFFCQVLRAQYRWLVVLAGSIGLASGVAAVAVALNLETIVVDILGKDPTFTGRTLIWASAAELLKSQPWLGFGYQAFWHGMEGPSAYIIREVMWIVPDAHNGFVELALHLGLIGLALFFIGYFINVIRSIIVVRSTTGIQHIWPLAYLANIFLANIPEQSLLKSNTIFWVLYVSVSVTLFMPTLAESEGEEPQARFYPVSVKNGKYRPIYRRAQATRHRRIAEPSSSRGVVEAER